MIDKKILTHKIYIILGNIKFKTNGDITRLTIGMLINSVISYHLENLKSQRELYNYSVVCDDSNNTVEDINTNKFNVKVYAQKSPGILPIPINFVINPNV
jgi:hypothetical protein